MWLQSEKENQNTTRRVNNEIMVAVDNIEMITFYYQRALNMAGQSPAVLKL